jgi:hypothetical protein
MSAGSVALDDKSRSDAKVSGNVLRLTPIFWIVLFNSHLIMPIPLGFAEVSIDDLTSAGNDVIGKADGPSGLKISTAPS